MDLQFPHPARDKLGELGTAVKNDDIIQKTIPPEKGVYSKGILSESNHSFQKNRKPVYSLNACFLLPVQGCIS